MKCTILAVLLTSMLSFTTREKANKLVGNPGSSGSIQVIELFTSEGCSSCPAADKLLENISQTFRHKVIVLGFHVDYWNKLGWKDRFSDPRYSERQRRYAGTIPKGEVYTPQVIVNGREQMVGSDEKVLLASINHFMAVAQPVQLNAQAKMDGKVIQVACDFPAGNDHQLNIAVVQVNAETQVLAGENQGRTLHHVNVVRAFMTLSQPIALAYLELSDKVITPKDYRVVVFVQDRKTMKIIASTDFLPLQ